MIYGFTADHSDLAGSRCEGTIIKDGINYGQMIVFVLYPIDLIVVHDPIARKKHNISMSEYNNYEGNMYNFLIHVLTTREETNCERTD